MSERFVHLGGRGKFHIDTGGTTVCGKPVTYPTRTTIHTPAVCARCAKDTAAYERAEAFRKTAWADVNDRVTAQRDAERAGRFTVYRCRLCGTQHHTRPGEQRGVPFCMTAFHEADLEEIVVQGPPWIDPSSPSPVSPSGESRTPCADGPCTLTAPGCAGPSLQETEQ